MNVLVSGLFLRRSAWALAKTGTSSFDHLRDSECGLDEWVNTAVGALEKVDQPLRLYGHSFGGYLAQCLAARLGPQAVHLYLFSALVSSGASAFETYQESGQDELLDICRLDFSTGRIMLSNPSKFLSLLGHPVDIATSEPCQMAIESPKLFLPACPVTYVVCNDDRMTDANLQRHFARRLDAREIEYPGGHLTPLMDKAFLDSL